MVEQKKKSLSKLSKSRASVQKQDSDVNSYSSFDDEEDAIPTPNKMKTKEQSTEQHDASYRRRRVRRSRSRRVRRRTSRPSKRRSRSNRSKLN